MQKIIPLLLCLALPLAAFAQTAPAPSMLVVNNGAVASDPATADNTPEPSHPADTTKMMANFPSAAISDARKPTVPAPAADTPGAAALNATAKKWPSDAGSIFMKSCVAMHQEFVQPCQCIITRIMDEVPFDEFTRMNDDGTLSQDSRVAAIHEQCVTKPQQRK